MLVLTREQVRRIDQLAIEELGIPGIVLMENAGRSAVTSALELLRSRPGGVSTRASAAVLCGGGNNGGDGYVIARHLHNAGIRVSIFAAKSPGELTGDAAVNARIARTMGLPIEPIQDEAQVTVNAAAWLKADLIVDALLGTGFTGEVRPPLRQIIEQCNAIRAQAEGRSAGDHCPRPLIMSVDLPSGMDCDTGQAGGVAVKADITITFVAAKVGFAFREAQALLGSVIVGDIGVPPELVRRIASGG